MPEAYTETRCSDPVQTVWERVLTELKTMGATVFCTIDHAANAQRAGLTLSPSRVVIFGKAEVGTPLMQKAPHMALDLPLRCMVRQDEDGTVFTCMTPEHLAERHGIEHDHPSIRTMQGAMRRLAAAAQGHTLG